MAKVKIQGHASGSGVITVTAPNTSTDRTITLPDETATLSTFDPDGAVTINDTGADVDFRVESDGNANMLFVDGGNNRVGIGQATPAVILDVKGTVSAGATTDEVLQEWSIGSENVTANIEYTDVTTSRGMNLGTSTGHNFILKTDDTTRLTLTSDGRGLSQFTAKAWAFFNGTGTPALIDSHNCSSITDMETGIHRVNFSNALGNTDFVVNYTTMNETSNSNCNTSVSITGKTTSCSGNLTKYENNSLADPGRGSIVVFGD